MFVQSRSSIIRDGVDSVHVLSDGHESDSPYFPIIAIYEMVGPQ